VEQAMDLSYDRLRNDDDDDPGHSTGSIPVFCSSAHHMTQRSRKPSLSMSWRTHGRELETIKRTEARRDSMRPRFEPGSCQIKSHSQRLVSFQHTYASRRLDDVQHCECYF
jgi:hypothetical protein